MAMDIDWNTLLLTTFTCGISALAGAWFGAFLAFKNDRKLEKEKKQEKELSSIYTYYGHLLNLFNGYNSWADSFIQYGNRFHIEHNISKIKNHTSNNWGNLGFIMQNSLKLYEQVFLLERGIEITIEKTNLYAEKAGSGNTAITAYIIAKRQYAEVYAEIVAMLESFNNYAVAYYNKSLITNEMNLKLKEAEEKIKTIVEDISNTDCLLNDNDDFLKRMQSKKNWYLNF